MKGKFPLVILLILIVSAGAYLYKRQNAQRQTVVRPTPATAQWTTATFEGTLPCADCSGLKTVITLSQNKEGTGGAYVEKSTYLGKGPDNTFEVKGDWKLLHDLKGASKQTIYVLSEKPGQSETYLVVDPEHIVLLDQTMKPLTGSGLNFTLTKTSSR